MEETTPNNQPQTVNAPQARQPQAATAAAAQAVSAASCDAHAQDAAAPQASTGSSAASHAIEQAATPMAKLGVPIRLFEVYFVVVVLGWLGYAVPTEGNEFALDLGALFVLAQIVCYAVCVWLIERRSIYARMLIAVNMAALIVLSFPAVAPTFAAVFAGEGGTFAFRPGVLVSAAVFGYGGAIAALLYFAFSKHAKAVLCIRPRKGKQGRIYAPHNIFENFKTWAFWRDLAIYYFVFSILGHWAELAFCQLIRLGIVMGEYDTSNAMLFEQWLYPFPAEGIAVVLIILILYPLKEVVLQKMNGRVLPTLVISFLLNALVCTSIDFTTGITANADYHLWDYRAMPFNFMGQICLQNSIVYSVAATIVVWVVYPAVEALMRKIPNYVQNTVFVGFAALYFFLELIYVVNVGDAGLIFG